MARVSDLPKLDHEIAQLEAAIAHRVERIATLRRTRARLVAAAASAARRQSEKAARAEEAVRLYRASGSVTHVAATMGISKNTAYQLLRPARQAEQIPYAHSGFLKES